jgi:hypothetical protein
MIKLRYPKKLFRRSSSKGSTTSSSSDGDAGSVRGGGEIEWEVRPGGMLVQKRDCRADVEVITVRVATGFSWHDVSVVATCTFGQYSCSAFLLYSFAPPNLSYFSQELKAAMFSYIVKVVCRSALL